MVEHVLQSCWPRRPVLRLSASGLRVALEVVESILPAMNLLIHAFRWRSQNWHLHWILLSRSRNNTFASSMILIGRAFCNLVRHSCTVLIGCVFFTLRREKAKINLSERHRQPSSNRLGAGLCRRSLWQQSTTEEDFSEDSNARKVWKKHRQQQQQTLQIKPILDLISLPHPYHLPSKGKSDPLFYRDVYFPE